MLEVSLSRSSPLPRPWSTCCHKCIKRAIIWLPKWNLLCAIKASCCHVYWAILEQYCSTCPTRHLFIGQYSIRTQWTKSNKLITFSHVWKRKPSISYRESCLVQIWSSTALICRRPSILCPEPSWLVLPPKNGVQMMIVAFRPYCESLFQMINTRTVINTYPYLLQIFIIFARFVLLCFYQLYLLNKAHTILIELIENKCVE